MAQKNLISRAYQRWRLTWRDHLESPLNRFFAHFDAHVSDHAFLRAAWTNLHEITPGVYRSNQPSPARLKKYAGMGIKTIVNLRGPSDFGSYVLEERVCKELGINLINMRMYSRRLPKVPEVLAAKEMFESLDKPFLMHCKSGADRAGIASALYCLLIMNSSAEEALEQLSFKFLHIKEAKTGILDFFVQAYLEFNEKQPTSFLDWVENHYDRDTLKGQFKSSGAANILVDKLLRRE